MRPRLLASLAAAAAVAAPLAGCGDKQSVIKSADTEAAYLDLGQLRYQVEISRQLNPADIEDRTYLVGIPHSVGVLRPGESWFAIFVRVENDNKQPMQAATDFQLTDTQGTTYRPVPIPRSNPFAYVGGRVPANSTL